MNMDVVPLPIVRTDCAPGCRDAVAVDEADDAATEVRTIISSFRHKTFTFVTIFAMFASITKATTVAGVWKNGTDVNGNVHGNNGKDKDECATIAAKEKITLKGGGK